jgi:universal stress protein A
MMIPLRMPKPTFRSILCPVDFSTPSRRALQVATTLADRLAARVTVLYVDDPLLSEAARMAFDERSLARTADADLRRFVQAAVGTVKRPRAIAYENVSGQPAREIERAVRRTSADMIVMGTHGRSGANKLVFGSTTEAVLRKSRVPVLAVPARR